MIGEISFAIVLIVAIVCITLLLGIYMSWCHEDGVKMFEDTSQYEWRIQVLEKKIKELENKL